MRACVSVCVCVCRTRVRACVRACVRGMKGQREEVMEVTKAGLRIRGILIAGARAVGINCLHHSPVRTGNAVVGPNGIIGVAASRARFVAVAAKNGLGGAAVASTTGA